MKKKARIWLTTTLLVVFVGIHLTSVGCSVINPKPVSLSLEYRDQVKSAVMILTELESRFDLVSDPNDCKLAMRTAKESLQIILDADAGGVE